MQRQLGWLTGDIAKDFFHEEELMAQSQSQSQ
jgi:hypothetical protein